MIDGQVKKVVVGEILGDGLRIPNIELDAVCGSCIHLQLMTLCDGNGRDGEINDAVYLGSGRSDG